MKDKIKLGIKAWIKLWPDIWAAPLALAALYISYYLLVFVDPTVGTYDIGTLQALLFTIVILVVLNTAAFLGLAYNDNGLWNYYKAKYQDNGLPVVEHTDESDFENLTAWQRIKLLYFWRAFLLLLGVVIFVNLI